VIIVIIKIPEVVPVIVGIHAVGTVS